MVKLDQVHLTSKELLQYSWQQSFVGTDSPLAKQSHKGKSQAFQTSACIILILINKWSNQHFFNSFYNTLGTEETCFCICHGSNTTSNRTFLQAYLIYFFKHSLKLVYIRKFLELQNFYSAQSQLPPICNTSKGGGREGYVKKCYFCLILKTPKHEIQKQQQQQL